MQHTISTFRDDPEPIPVDDIYVSTGSPDEIIFEFTHGAQIYWPPQQCKAPLMTTKMVLDRRTIAVALKFDAKYTRPDGLCADVNKLEEIEATITLKTKLVRAANGTFYTVLMQDLDLDAPNGA